MAMSEFTFSRSITSTALTITGHDSALTLTNASNLQESRIGGARNSFENRNMSEILEKQMNFTVDHWLIIFHKSSILHVSVEIVVDA